MLTTTSLAARIWGRNCRNRSGSCVGRPSRGTRACRCTMAAPARAAPIALSAICSGVIGRCGDIVGVWIAPVMAHVTMTFLPGIAWLRQTADTETRHAEQASGEVLRFHFLCEQIVNRGVLHARHRGDVELVEVVATEHDARDVAHRHADAAIDRAVRRVTDEVAGDELRVPD